MQKLVYLFIPFAILATVLRVIQLKCAIDQETGFYLEGHSSIYILNTLLVVLCVVLIFPILFKKKSNTELITIKHPHEILSNSNGILSLEQGLLGGVYLAIGLYNIWLFIQSGTGSSDSSTANIFLGLFEILSCILFFMLVLYNKDKSPSLLGMMSLLPVLWSATRLIIMFIENTSIANISGRLFVLLVIIAGTLFLLSHTRAVLGVPNWRAVICFGLLTVLFTCVSIVAGIAYSLMEGTTLHIAYEELIDIALSVYAITLAFKLTSKDFTEKYEAKKMAK